MIQLKVLIRSFVHTFYEANIGFFLVVLYIAFGLMSGTEHIALAQSIATSLPLTLLTILLWFVYWLMVLSFAYKLIQLKSYTFIKQFSFQPKTFQILLLFVIFLIMGGLTWMYASFISIYYLKFKSFSLFAIAITFLFAINSTATLVTVKLLKHPIREPGPGLWHRVFSKRISLPLPLWHIRHLFVYEPLLVFLSKLGSLLLLLGTFFLFKTDLYDWRLLAVGVLFAVTTNSMFVYNLYEFYGKNSWIKNLPRRPFQIIVTNLFTLLLLFLPEILVLSYQMPAGLTIGSIAGLLLFGVSYSFFLISWQTKFSNSKEGYAKRSFYIMLLLLLAILYKVPLLITNLVLLISGALVTSWYYNLIKDN